MEALGETLYTAHQDVKLSLVEGISTLLPLLKEGLSTSDKNGGEFTSGTESERGRSESGSSDDERTESKVVA